MSAIQHTPGPWAWGREEDGYVTLSPGVMICSCSTDGTPYGDEHDRANARLIATAPEMLAALKAVDALGMLNPTGSGTVEDAARAVKAAIANAEGWS